MTQAPRILLFTKTTGYRHDSIGDGVSLITECAENAGVGVDHTEDAGVFTIEHLREYAATVWLQVSGDVLTDAGRSAFHDYVRGGGGFAGIHGAAFAELSSPEYEEIVGARFAYHPENGCQTAVLHKEGHHASIEAVPDPWIWDEEWYAFERNPRGTCTILLRVDESTYDPERVSMGADHPIAWCGTYGLGKTWYTSLGHHAAAYTEPPFREHLWNGITSVLNTTM